MSLNPNQFMFHYADPSDRASIAQKGLLTRHPSRGSLAEDDGQPAGVYMFHDRHQADVLAGDTYRVNTAGLNVQDDPFHAGDGIAAFVPHPIERSRLSLLKRDT